MMIDDDGQRPATIAHPAFLWSAEIKKKRSNKHVIANLFKSILKSAKIEIYFKLLNVRDKQTLLIFI